MHPSRGSCCCHRWWCWWLRSSTRGGERFAGQAGWLAIPEIPEICNYIMYGEIVYLKKRLKVLPAKISAGEEQHFRTVFHGLAFYCTELCLNLADKWTAINFLERAWGWDARCCGSAGFIAWWSFILIAICCGRSIDRFEITRAGEKESGWVAVTVPSIW